MMGFEFATSRRIIFGCGKAKKIGEICRDLGSNCLLVYSPSSAKYEIGKEILASGKSCKMILTDGEPTIASLEALIKTAREFQPDFIIAVGGGSTLDAAKALSALITNPGGLMDYLEVIGRNHPLVSEPVPLIAMPTTAGTGTEVTRNAVLKSTEAGVKVSLRSEKMIPRLALIDPELTLSLPPAVTAATGMDALVQLIEPFVSNRANDLVDLFCREGINRIMRSIIHVYQEPDNLQAREDMSYSSLLGGLALANAGLGVVHGFAAVLGGMFEIPHGQCCARLLPAAFAINIQALQKRQPDSPSLSKFLEISQELTGSTNAGYEDGFKWLVNLCEELHIPKLSSFGINEIDADEIVAKQNQPVRQREILSN